MTNELKNKKIIGTFHTGFEIEKTEDFILSKDYFLSPIFEVFKNMIAEKLNYAKLEGKQIISLTIECQSEEL